MWPNPKQTADLVKFTEEILNRKLHSLCSVYWTYPLRNIAATLKEIATGQAQENVLWEECGESLCSGKTVHPQPPSIIFLSSKKN